MAGSYINKYSGTNAQSDYEGDTARIALNKSTVNLVNKTLHFDGKNINAVVPKQGDVLYAPSNCAYTPESDGSVPSATELSAYGTGVDGWENYLRSRFIKYPSAFNSLIYKDGKAETKILTDINASEGRAFFPVGNFAVTHNTTYGSFGSNKNFWNIDGLRYGDWFMAGLKVQRELFKNVACSDSSVLKSTDRVNIAMSKISSTRISLYENWWWLPVLRSRGYTWGIGTSGNLDGSADTTLYHAYRVLSCTHINI